MAYLKCLLAGLAALVLTVALFTGGIGMFYLDARWPMGQYWFLSLPMMAATFLAGFVWEFKRSRKGRGELPEKKTGDSPLF